MSEAAPAEVTKADPAPAAPAVDPNAPAPTPEETKPGRTYTQAELDEITRKVRANARHRTKREVEAYYRGRLESQPQPQQPQRQEPPADDAPRREQYETYEEFIEAKARHTARKEAAEATRKTLEESRKADHENRVRASQEKESKVWNEQVDKARGEIEDFDEVCERSEAPVTDAMASAIRESDKGALIAYHLAKNPEEAERISKLTPARQAAAIVALEEKVAKPTKAPSKAPAPISPVGKTSDTAEPIDTRDPRAAEKLSTSEWIRRDRERMAKAGIR